MAAAGGLLWWLLIPLLTITRAAMVAGCLAMGLGCTTTSEDRWLLPLQTGAQGWDGQGHPGRPLHLPIHLQGEPRPGGNPPQGITYTSCTNRTDPEGLLWCSTQVPD